MISFRFLLMGATGGERVLLSERPAFVPLFGAGLQEQASYRSKLFPAKAGGSER